MFKATQKKIHSKLFPNQRGLHEWLTSNIKSNIKHKLNR